MLLTSSHVTINYSAFVLGRAEGTPAPIQKQSNYITHKYILLTIGLNIERSGRVAMGANSGCFPIACFILSLPDYIEGVHQVHNSGCGLTSGCEAHLLYPYSGGQHECPFLFFE